MTETDMFAHTVGKFGAPDQAEKVSAEEAARYADRLPDALLRFWRTYGRGSYQQGKFWFCDPAPFQPVIEEIFHNDPDFDPAEMTAFGYTAFATLKVWHRRRRKVNVDFLRLQVFNPPESSWHDKEGRPFSQDFIIGCHATEFQYSPAHVDNAGEDLLPRAIARLGELEPGELYGFIPMLHFGGTEAVKNLRRVAAAEHMLIVAETANFNLTRLTPPAPPRDPYGRVEIVRRIGGRASR